MLDAGLNALDGGFIELYTGSQPASPDVAVTTQVLIAKLQLSSPAFTNAAAGTKTANMIPSAVAVASGAPTWFRAYQSDSSTAVDDGSAGISGCDMTLNDADFVLGGAVTVTSWAVSMPAGG